MDKREEEVSTPALQRGLMALAAVFAEGNRLPTRATLRAGRSRRSFEAAWAPVEEARNANIKELGVELPGRPACVACGRPEDKGGWSVRPGMPGWPEWEKRVEEMNAEKHKVTIEPITVSEFDAGYYRDPETGRKEDGLRIAGHHIGALEELGLLVDDPTPEEAPA